MKSTAYIFGAGGTGQRVLGIVKEKYKILGFVDNDKTKWGTSVFGYEIFPPDKLIQDIELDYVLLGTLMGYEELQIQMKEMGILPNTPFDRHIKRMV